MDGVEAVLRPERLRGHILGGSLPHAGGDQLDPGPVRHQLQAVLVPGDGHAFPPCGLALPGDGADEVVGLVARKLVPGDVHGVQHLLEDGHLDGKLLGHPLALGLVAVVGKVAEGGLPPVEGDAQGVGRLLLRQAQQGGHKAVDRVGWRTVPGGQGAHAVKRAIDDAVSVDHHQLHRGPSSVFFPLIIPCFGQITTRKRSGKRGVSSCHSPSDALYC